MSSIAKVGYSYTPSVTRNSEIPKFNRLNNPLQQDSVEFTTRNNVSFTSFSFFKPSKGDIARKNMKNVIKWATNELEVNKDHKFMVGEYEFVGRVNGNIKKKFDGAIKHCGNYNGPEFIDSMGLGLMDNLVKTNPETAPVFAEFFGRMLKTGYEDTMDSPSLDRIFNAAYKKLVVKCKELFLSSSTVTSPSTRLV